MEFVNVQVIPKMPKSQPETYYHMVSAANGPKNSRENQVKIEPKHTHTKKNRINISSDALLIARHIQFGTWIRFMSKKCSLMDEKAFKIL